MAGLFPFPRLTDELIENASCSISNYEFLFAVKSKKDWVPLNLDKSRSKSKLYDRDNIWKAAEDNLLVEKTVTIAYPEFLFGPDGIVPSNATLGICLIWKSSKLNIQGIILPSKEVDGTDYRCWFSHTFEPGELSGDLTLDLSLYVKSADSNPHPDECHLANEAGIILGSLEEPVSLILDSDYMDFPIIEVNIPGEPLWRMEFGEWSDPREDPFSEDSFALLLNTAHPNCPIASGKDENTGTLLEMMASAYYLIFEKVHNFPDEDAWADTIEGGDRLAKGSISSVLHWFANSGTFVFDWSMSEDTMFDVKRIIELHMRGGGKNEN